jgi:apolipoprotein N-acyltransferase
MAYVPKLLTLPADHPALTRALVCLTGALTTFVFAPFSLALFAPLLLLPLLFVCLTQAPREAGVHGFWFGIGLFLAGTYWIYISVVVFGQAPVWVALLLLLGLAVIMAVWLFAAAYCLSYLAQGEPLRLILAAPAVWALVEWLRGWIATGFPWLAYGYGQVGTPLAGWAPLGGVYAASFAMVLSSAALLAAFFGAGRARRIAAVLIVLPWLAGGLLLLPDWTREEGDPLTITILQAGLSQDRKWLPEMREPTLEFYRDQTRIAHESDLVVWPEVAVPSLLSRERGFLAQLQADARESGQTMLFGILEDVDERGTRHIYNSVVLQDGTRQQVYRKRHLVPFGEYFPVPDRVREWMRMMSLPHSDISAGAEVQPLLETRGGTELAVMICYEDAYNSEQLYALPEAGLLVNVSNDAWFGDSIAAHQHLEIAQMRSLEVGRPGIRATNTGVSAFIDHRGRLLEAGPQFVPVTLTGTLVPRAGETPFAASGNAPIVVLCLLAIVLLRLRMR